MTTYDIAAAEWGTEGTEGICPACHGQGYHDEAQENCPCCKGEGTV